MMEEYMSTSEVMAYLRVSKSTMKRFKSRDDFPKPIFKSYRYFYRRKDIENFISKSIA